MWRLHRWSRSQNPIPFQAKCVVAIDACSSDMLVLIHWQKRIMAVSLSQPIATEADESTAEAIGDWHLLGDAGLLLLSQVVPAPSHTFAARP